LENIDKNELILYINDKEKKMVEKIELKELMIVDINKNILDNYSRFKEIKRRYNYENGIWAIIDDDWIDDWDKEKKDKVINNFFDIISKEGGYVFGAYEDKKMIGFSVLCNKKFGSNNQYIQLDNMHVSDGYRNKGIGKKLFEICVKKAKETGIKKIYISANPSEDTVNFYFSVGCKDAMEINKELAEKEPYDRQMEYEI
jgi:predicted N-acetyltransferase YhbS